MSLQDYIIAGGAIGGSVFVAGYVGHKLGNWWTAEHIPAIYNVTQLEKRLQMHEFDDDRIRTEVAKIEKHWDTDAIGPLILRHGVPSTVSPGYREVIHQIVHGLDKHYFEDKKASESPSEPSLPQKDLRIEFVIRHSE